jgi:DNA (cytosine-5)-methyltransferase 1
MPAFYEFFAGGGMARAGLGAGWDCVFANDFDAKKALSYQANWGAGGPLTVGDIAALKVSDLYGCADLVWASFPCQDLSLAGAGAGLNGQRSGSFYPFWQLMNGLKREGRAPKLIVLENVCGTLTSRSGADFNTICQTYVDAGYRYGAVVINASQFVPQSRARLFFIGVHQDVEIDPDWVSPQPLEPYHSRGLIKAFEGVPHKLLSKRLWWNLPTPAHRQSCFADLIEAMPQDVVWHSPKETRPY